MENICPICLELLTCITTIKTECNHIFCVVCLESWINYKHNCPVCRHNIINIYTIPQYYKKYKIIIPELKYDIAKLNNYKNQKWKYEQLTHEYFKWIVGIRTSKPII